MGTPFAGNTQIVDLAKPDTSPNEAAKWRCQKVHFVIQWHIKHTVSPGAGFSLEYRTSTSSSHQHQGIQNAASIEVGEF